jgi:hypothetical protein
MSRIRFTKAVVAPSLLAAIVGSTASADYTKFEFQVSPAGQETWSSKLDAHPGDAIDYRVRVSYVGNSATPVGLGGGATFQPVVSNWTAGDVLAPFAKVGGNTTGGAVPDAPGQYGRVLPWAKVGTGMTDALRGHVNGSFLRIAKSQVTSWFGGAGNTTGNSGVQIGQLNNTGRTTNDPAFNPGLTDLVVFKVKIILDPLNTSVRDMQVYTPQEWAGELSLSTMERLVFWYANMTEGVGSIRVPAQVEGAVIHVVPAPGSVSALCLLMGTVAVRRRRR